MNALKALANLFVNLAVHAGTAVAALAVFGVFHRLTDSGLWLVFPDSFHVREFSLYLINLLPIWIVLAVAGGIALDMRRTGRPLSMHAYIGFGGALLAATLFLHAPLFTTDFRGIAAATVFALGYLGLYPLVAAVAFRMLRPIAALTPAPNVGPVLRPLLATGLVWMVAAGALVAYQAVTGARQDEVYVEDREPSAPDTWYRASTAAGRPRPELLTAVDSGIPAGMARTVDVDGDGRYDIVLLTDDRRLEFWRNTPDGFRRQDAFIPDAINANVHDYYFADVDGDGRQDLMISHYTQPRQSDFVTTFLKKIYWYPWTSPVNVGRLLLQRAPGRWEDVTARAFAETPWAYRKVEPMLWFDANGDGRLDLLWAQYPIPGRHLNKLYIQAADGTFSDRAGEMILADMRDIYAEGFDIADLDDDGDIDLFAYGYLFSKQDGKFQQRCGDAAPRLPCGAAGRFEEAALFEDFDGDGAFDFAISYHGPGANYPKYHLQFFKGQPGKPWTFTHDEANGRRFYGFNSYLRAKDFDGNGTLDILTTTAGRLLALDGGLWVDLWPALKGGRAQPTRMIGWIDVDEDGDWDFVASDQGAKTMTVYRNGLDPARYMKIDVRGVGGLDNQQGATLRITGADGRVKLHAHRPVAGYAGVVDPRLIVPLGDDRHYSIRACFASLPAAPGTSSMPDGVRLTATPEGGTCVRYEIDIDPAVKRLDLTLIAGPEGARARVGDARN